MHVLLTGAAGFIGYQAPLALLAASHTVTAVGEINSYYSPELKRNRLAAIGEQKYRFARADIFKCGPPGDARETYADTSRAVRDIAFAPKISLAEGIGHFVSCFRHHHRL